MKIYVRQDKSFIEDCQYGGRSLERLYNTWYGRVLSKFILLPVFSYSSAVSGLPGCKAGAKGSFPFPAA